MRVLVTGGSGFIGSHVVDRLVAEGHEPRVFDLVPSEHLDPGVEVVIGDILDAGLAARAMRGCGAVVHLAAVADVDRVQEDPVQADMVNVRGTGMLLEAARAEGIGRLVYASTIWVYGGGNGNGNGHGPLDEDAPLALPDHLYTATKLAGEMYCRSYGSLYGLEHTILRFGIPYGPRARLGAVVPNFVGRALAGQPLRIAGDGSQSRQFVYVEDLAEGVAAALRPSAVGRIYNLVGHEAVSVGTIAEMVRDLVADVPIDYMPGRSADLRRAQVSGARAARELGWEPRTRFAEGLRRYVAWVTGGDGAASSSASDSTTEAADGSSAKERSGGLRATSARAIAARRLACEATTSAKP